MEKPNNEPQTWKQRLPNIIGIVICVLLVPILILNSILLIKGLANKDEVPSIGGYLPMFVMTDSMSGTIEAGDLIVCKYIEADQVKVEDIISFFDPQGTGTSVVTHRVKEIVPNADGSISFRTKGDANNTVDPVPVPAESLIGIYTNFRLAGAGHVVMFMQTVPGLLICVLVPIVALVGYDIIRRRLYEKKHGTDKDALMQELEELRRRMAEQQASAQPTQAAPQAPPPSDEPTDPPAAE